MSRAFGSSRPTLPRLPGWGVPAVCIVGAGVILGGIAYGIGHHTAPILIGILAAVLIAAVIVLNRRHRNRVELVDKFLLAITPLLGHGLPSRAHVHASRWSGPFMSGLPRRLVISYHPGIDETDPKFTSELLDHAERRLGLRYRITKDDDRRCLKTLVSTEKDAALPEAESRVRALIRETLGAVTVDPTMEGEHLVAFTVQYGMGTKLTKLPVRRQFEKIVEVSLPGRWRAHWDLERDWVRFELKPEMPKMIVHEPPAQLPELTHRSYMEAEIPYATDEDGKVIVWKPSRDPHMLIVGGTGSGKTTCEHTILTAVAQLGWRVHVLDGKEIEFLGFHAWPNVELVADSVEAQVRMVQNAHDIMKERYAQIKARKATKADFDPLVVVIDEYASFKASVDAWYPEVKPKGGPTKPRVYNQIANIARLGRSAKVHLVIGIQRPDVTFVDGEMRDNFGARTSLGRLSPQGAQMMWDSQAIGVTRAPRGHGIALDADGNPVEVLTHYTPNPEDAQNVDDVEYQRLQALLPAETHYPRMMVAPPREIEEFEDLELVTYDMYAHAPIVPFDGDAQPALRTTPRPAPAADDETSLDDDTEREHSSNSGDPLDDYELPSPVAATDLEPGMAICYDDSLSVWGVVTSVEDDGLSDGESLFIEYRDLQTGEDGILSVNEDDPIDARSPKGE